VSERRGGDQDQPDLPAEKDSEQSAAQEAAAVAAEKEESGAETVV
jgi:hypothetical protein